AIIPSLEYNDIDDIKTIVTGGSSFTLTMKNEALETHFIRSADLIAVPKTDSHSMILHGNDDKFYHAYNPQKCHEIFSKYDITKEDIEKRDHKEWSSLANEKDLATKGEIILQFDNTSLKSSGNLGLSMTFRQTLMTTYVLYHGLSYMGDEYTDMLASVEISKHRKEKTTKSLLSFLGKIDVYSANSMNKPAWKYAGSFYETGPIAKNSQVCPLTGLNISKNGAPVFIKLVFNEGLWKFDEISLVEIQEAKHTLSISPKIVKQPDEAGKANPEIRETAFPITSLPGDEYELRYEIPSHFSAYQLFLSAKGYYLEWMRAEWLKDKNIKKLTQ